MVAQARVDRLRVPVTGREQVVEEEPVAVDVVAVLASELVAMAPAVDEADVPAAVVDQVAGDEDRLAGLLRVLVEAVRRSGSSC